MRWSSSPTEEQEALATGIAELASLAIERAEWQAREQEARLRTGLAEGLTREREALIHQILHDLRNPVQAIALMNMDLAHWAQDAPEAASSVEAIERQVIFMSNFLQQKLDRLVNGHEAHQEADLVQVLHDLERRFRLLCQAKGQSLAVHASGSTRLPLPAIELAQILGNLLDNAVKFSPPAGSIRVDVNVANGWAIFRVADTGPGFTANPTGFGGFGLGLGHARELVQHAGGWMRQTDTPQGALVEVGLPTLNWGKAQSPPD